ncbi:glycoside hydrolase family 97 N-terminal domain-containing protein, partial [Candidatus Saccharibacteria bacterium]|nr:glycoside hydrolase family 97 N-terminal domain-containing protein [Candidatus Saccharibacteria bacterium]
MVNFMQAFLNWIHGIKSPLSDTEKILASPDGTVKIKISLRQGHISYSVTKGESTILRESRLGFKIK